MARTRRTRGNGRDHCATARRSPTGAYTLSGSSRRRGQGRTHRTKRPVRRMTDVALACPEPPASQAAADVVSRGGNAVDAAIGGAFGQAVSNPLGTGIGGMAQILVVPEGKREPIAIAAAGQIGGRADPAMFLSDFVGRAERAGRYMVRGDRNQVGYESILVPGFIAGMRRLSDHGSGRLNWSAYVEPAARLATDGFAVYPYLARYYTLEGPSRHGFPNYREKLSRDSYATEVYMRGSRGLAAGEHLRQPEYGTTLQRIACDAEAFYLGEVAEEMARDLSTHGSSITLDDLNNYEAYVSSPVSLKFRDLEIFTSPPPSHGVTLLMMFALVEDLAIERMEHNGADYIELVAWATRTAFSETLPYTGDPAFVDVPVAWMLDRDRLNTLPRQTNQGADFSSVISEHTTHLSACDSNGNFASITHSIGSICGAGVMTRSLGFLYNNLLGHFNVLRGFHDSIVPGKRFGGGCPTIVFRDGNPWLSIGSSGGPRLISAVFQNLLNVRVFGMNLTEAVAAPRVHSEYGNRIYLEPSLAKSVGNELEGRGYEVVETEYMGCNQAVSKVGDAFEVGSDPRGGMGILDPRGVSERGV
jgi:gamma-glutamyltranspeptidase/glutathione hydrolase